MMSISVTIVGFIACRPAKLYFALPFSLVPLSRCFHVDLQEKGRCRAWPRQWTICLP